jgi:hypothetical protein
LSLPNEAHDVLVRAMADVGVYRAFLYAFLTTGVYVCERETTNSPPLDRPATPEFVGFGEVWAVIAFPNDGSV